MSLLTAEEYIVIISVTEMNAAIALLLVSPLLALMVAPPVILCLVSCIGIPTYVIVQRYRTRRQMTIYSQGVYMVLE